jgi:hypothetical protein
MEHPLVQIDSEISIDDLTEKVNELTRKLGIAYRSGNRNLASQITMALETYKNRLSEKQEELYNNRNKNSPDFSNKINVS